MSRPAPVREWITPRIRDLNPSGSNGREAEHIRVSLADDMPNPVDFRLPPDEYARLYAEKHGEAVDDQEAADRQTDQAEERTSRDAPQFWLEGSISPSLQDEDTDKPMVEIIENRPAATFDLDPDEYRRIRDELEKEREATTGYFHDPIHFWSMGSIWD